MLRNTLIDLNSSYTFSDYFKIDIDCESLAIIFDYSLTLQKIEFQNIEEDISNLQNEIEIAMKFVKSKNEQSIREFIISPILFHLLKKIEFSVEVEKNLQFNNLLKGTLDYFLTQKRSLIVIEAKKSDLESGFRQLIVELIAVDKLLESDENEIFGAVSIGIDWIFAKLDRETKEITKDLKIYRVPEELNRVVSILTQILSKEKQ
jgi:predicted transcriptional regulator